MLTPKYHILLNGKYFEAIYPTDHYNDKKVFFDSGAKQFFTIYQLACRKKFTLSIKDLESGSEIELKDENDFRLWIEKNYPMYLKHLENYN